MHDHFSPIVLINVINILAKQYNTKKPKTRIYLEKLYVRLPSNKNYIDQCI